MSKLAAMRAKQEADYAERLKAGVVREPNAPFFTKPADVVPKQTAQPAALSKPERERLVDHELIIQTGLRSFLEVGSALLAIRDEHLYRESHPSWEAYCRDRWKMSDRNARRLMNAAVIAGEIGPIGPLPTSESQIRPLAQLPPADRQDAWSDAVSDANGAQPTAKHVEKAVRDRKPKAPKPTSQPDPSTSVDLHSKPPGLGRHLPHCITCRCGYS